jgi:flagellar basal-body rod protein FlgC
MSLYNIFNVAGSSMSAQSVRLNTVASNLANADVVSSNSKDAYKSRQPIFSSVMNSMDNSNQSSSVSVRVSGIVESTAEARQEYQPHHPLANKEGYIFKSNVNAIEEMANMMAASRSYQNNVEVFNTSKQLLLKTLNMGR